MSAPVLVLSPQGRMGNQVCQYLFARGWAEAHGYELRHEPFIGERIFQIEGVRPDGREVVRRNEHELCEISALGRECGERPTSDYEFRGYAQTQGCANFYTKRQAQSWLKFRPEIEAACAQVRPDDDTIICHLRRGDYAPYGYVVVSIDSYRNAMAHYGLDHRSARFLSEENPTPAGSLPADLSFVADFYRMVRAHTLLRANSSFSWLAALLGDGLVLSPVIDGLEGGREHGCRFTPGNWPRFANLDFTENLFVPDK